MTWISGPMRLPSHDYTDLADRSSSEFADDEADDAAVPVEPSSGEPT